MGFFDSFKSGAKDVFKGYDKVKLKDKITYDELYEIMKDETYSVGKPEITGSGLMRCIQFPAVDKYKIQNCYNFKNDYNFKNIQRCRRFGERDNR